MKNSNRYEILKGYCITVTSFFKERLKSSDLPYKREERFTQFSSGGSPTDSDMKVDWGYILFANEEVLARLDAHQHALQAMMDDQTIAKHLNTLVGIPGTGRRIEGPECLRWFVTRLLEEQQGIEFQENIFRKIYEDIEDFFYRDSFEFRIVCPLHLFQMQAERIALSPKLSIIRFSEEEKERMLARWGRYITPLSHRHNLAFFDFAFELYVESPKAIGGGLPENLEGDPLSVARYTFDDVCSTLRLFKNGAVFYGEYWMEPTSWNVIGSQGTSLRRWTSGHLYGPIYTLSEDEVPMFFEFWKSPRKGGMENNPNIMLAFNRLNFGYERLRPEDRLLDFTIGLEALFLLGLRNELGYRLSLRAAALLGDTPENRERIFNELKEAYDQRSIIAHGENPKKNINIGGSPIPFWELVNRVEEHLRTAIKEFLVRCEHQRYPFGKRPLTHPFSHLSNLPVVV